MSDYAVKVENISKRYRIGVQEAASDSLGGAVLRAFTKPARTFKQIRSLSSFSDSSDQDPDIIWALKNISFEIKQGEKLGIIGKNGAGKSTLLKVLSRITEPTYGQAFIKGKVSSLLEIGTGFHRDLTGRENVYLNGSILGMSRADIKGKFDEIVEFAGVEQFIDTPIKRYSSGMQVRLAFAVAAHVQPDILIVDEVLAVGDVEFQRKCIGKLDEQASDGKTVIFVSHNMGAIRRLCSQVILLDNGEISLKSDPDKAVNEYLSNSYTANALDSNNIDLNFEDDPSKTIQIKRIRLLNELGQPSYTFSNKYPIDLEMEIKVRERRKDAYLGCVMYMSDDSILGDSQTNDLEPKFEWRKPGSYLVKLRFPANVYNSGIYRLGAYAALSSDATDRRDFSFQIINGQPFGQTVGGSRKGALLLPLEWEFAESK